jgi:hypothetical protein
MKGCPVHPPLASKARNLVHPCASARLVGLRAEGAGTPLQRDRCLSAGWPPARSSPSRTYCRAPAVWTTNPSGIPSVRSPFAAPGGRRPSTSSSGWLSLLFAVGLRRTGPSHRGALPIDVWAVGLLGAGAFRTDPVSGYPVGTPDQLQHPTRVGAQHDLFFLIGFLALAASSSPCPTRRNGPSTRSPAVCSSQPRWHWPVPRSASINAGWTWAD